MAAITFDVGKKSAVFSLGAPTAIGVGFTVAVSGGGTPYEGEYVVDPNFSTQTLETKDKLLRENVTVNPIEVSRVSNPAGGKTIFIGGI